MVVKNKYSLAIVDIDKIDDINDVINKYAASTENYSTYFYFHLRPMKGEDINMDVTVFYLEAEDESELNKKLNDLVDELNQLNTGYVLRDEDSEEMIVEIEHVYIIDIKFDKVKYIKEGTYEKIDELNHLKTEFGICKNYNPHFRSVENMSIEDKAIEPETIYLFSDSAENLSKLKDFVYEKIMDIDPDFEIVPNTFWSD